MVKVNSKIRDCDIRIRSLAGDPTVVSQAIKSLTEGLLLIYTGDRKVLLGSLLTGKTGSEVSDYEIVKDLSNSFTDFRRIRVNHVNSAVYEVIARHFHLGCTKYDSDKDYFSEILVWVNSNYTATASFHRKNHFNKEDECLGRVVLNDNPELEQALIRISSHDY